MENSPGFLAYIARKISGLSMQSMLKKTFNIGKIKYNQKRSQKTENMKKDMHGDTTTKEKCM